MTNAAHQYGNDDAVLATMHGKERVIAPILQSLLGLNVRLVPGLDTDRFGTFSRDIERVGSQLAAARAKIAAAFEASPHARVAIASEGSFGPHPEIPFLPFAHEIVLLSDRTDDVELIGRDMGLETNFSHAVVESVAAAAEFAERAHFPYHGVIVMACVDQQPAPQQVLIKNIDDWAALQRATETVIASCGAAIIETDMRAHKNPTRMRAIARATEDLVRQFQSLCPRCARRGFGITETIRGLPCSLCGTPTLARKANGYVCVGCQYSEVRAVDRLTVDPSQCGQCNP